MKARDRKKRAARQAPARGQAVALTYKCCSVLLQYPGEETQALAEAVREALAELPAGAAREGVEQFLGWWDATTAIARQQHYVKVLDLGKRSGLYLTYYGEGDRRERGPALLRLKQLYRAGGWPLETGELPDFLPVMLEFAAVVPGGEGDIVLREHRAALELLRMSLRDAGSPYADLVDAVCAALGEASVEERLRAGQIAMSGPPSELVGLEPFAPPEIMPTAGARR